MKDLSADSLKVHFEGRVYSGYRSFQYKFIQSRCKYYFQVQGLKNEEYSPKIFSLFAHKLNME